MKAVETIMLFAKNEITSRSELREMISLLTRDELDLLGVTVSILNNDIKTEKALRSLRERKSETRISEVA